MRSTKLLFCICCLIAAIPAAFGQAANLQARSGVLGYLDPQTGAFRPVSAVAEDEDNAVPPPATTVGGTVSVTITITVKTNSLTNFTCSIAVLVTDNSTTGATQFHETNTVAATGSGSTRTCKLSIPYSWSLTTPTTDTMMTSYDVLGSTGTNGLPQRTGERIPLDNRKVPSNGTTTTLTASVTQ